MKEIMLPHEAFAEVIEKYNLKQHELVKASGIDKGVVSRFINGESDIKARNLQKLIKALPLQARAYYLMLSSYDSELNNNKVAEKSNKYKV
ncbi:MAG: helix-turn-helix transcriptional regulator [Cyanobacteria bacterium P01_A01_bin.40]